MRIVGKGAASPLWRGWALFVMCAVLAWSAQSIALLSSATATAFFSLAPEHSQSETLLLEPGNPVERELSGGQSHAYRLRLEAGHFARLVILQQGVGIRTTLFAPDGQKLAEVDGPYDTRGPEGVSFIANAAGEYHVEVRAVSNRQATGRYRLRLEGARPATPADNARIEAERIFLEAWRLGLQPDTWAAALEKFKEALPRWKDVGDRQEEAKTLYYVGRMYRFLDLNQDAQTYYSQALALQQDDKESTFSRRARIYTLKDIGVTCHLLGARQAALRHFEEGLRLCEAEGDRANQAVFLNNLGGVHDSLGDLQKAMDYYNRSLALRRELGDRSAEAKMLNNMGMVFDDMGEPQAALESYQNALALLQDIPSPDVDDLRTKSAALNNMAVLYEALGDSQNALQCLEQALPIRRRSKDRRGEALTLLNFGYVHTSLGDSRRALDYYNQALAICRELKDTWSEIYTLIYMGYAYATLGELPTALDKYFQALNLLETIEDPKAEATALDKIGQVYTLMGQPQKALERFDRALALWQAIGSRNSRALTLLGKARAERDLGQLQQARAHAEEALAALEVMRAKVRRQEARTLYFASVQQHYGFYIDLLMRMRKTDSSGELLAAALQANERARARSLLELLAEARADIRQGVAPALLERERALQQQINFKTERLARLLSGNPAAQQNELLRAEAEKEIERLLNQYQEVRAQIRAASPRYAALTQPQPVSLKEIQKQLLDPDTLLLEYSLGDEVSYLWAVTQSTIAGYELPKRAEIEAAAREVYMALTARQPIPDESEKQYRARVAAADKQFPEAAACLSRMILGPVAGQLGTRRLVIVADGALEYIPFAALPAPQQAGGRKQEAGGSRPSTNADTRHPTPDTQQPLIANHEIISLPSASVLAALRRETAGRRPAAKAVAVLADPVFEKDDFRVARAARMNTFINRAPAQTAAAGDAGSRQVLRDFGLLRDGAEMARLFASRREAAEIVSVAPKGQAMQALDFGASRRLATSAELRQYRIIHFATHGLVNDMRPELSAIVLSLVDEQGRPQNGFLRLHDIYNLDLPAELVVLSACQTGLGKQIRGEGLVGLVRGFMYAGSPRVAASLWKVNDQATARLMKRFYAGMLAEKLPAAAALRKAQVEMSKHRLWGHPYYWAAFTLQGEWK